MSALEEKETRFFMRRMQDEDLPAVLEIEHLSFSNPWSRETFRGEIQNRPFSFPMVVVERESGRVFGYILYWKIGDDAQVNNIAVHPDYRRQGVSEAMMRSVISRLRADGVNFVSLEVRCSNTAAISLYKKLGFEVLGTRKGYYTKPDEDAYVMGLVLQR